LEKSIYTAEYGVLVELLAELRENVYLSQAELAQRLGMSQSFVAKYERGKRRLDIIQLRRICQALNRPLGSVVRELEKRLKGFK
jgi:transcriptional regulator with XRE-family HTH domain